MSNHIEDKDTEHFPSAKEMRKRMDEMDKIFAGAKQNLDAIITMLDETLTQEEDFLRRGYNQYCIGRARNLSLEEQEFLQHRNTKLEP